MDNSYLNLLLEGDLSSVPQASGEDLLNLDTKNARDRMLSLINHPDWGPGIRSYLYQNWGKSLKDLLPQLKLKPGLKRWVQFGTFEGANKKSSPNREEIHNQQLRILLNKNLASRVAGLSPQEG